MLHIDFTGRLPHGMTSSLLQRLVNYTYKKAGGEGTGKVAISLVDDQTMKKLNKQYRGREGVTDVLSFAYNETGQDWFGLEDDKPINYLGEIIICLPQVRRQAKKIGRCISDETALMVVHGLLHLMGFDHTTLIEENHMFGLQQEILFGQKIIYHP